MYILAFVALCLFLGVRSLEVPVEDGIYVLSDENFNQFLQSHDFAFVEFYAPWCGHCKQLAPTFIDAAVSLKKSNINVPLAKVDCTQQKQICSEIQGYPTLKLYSKGKAADYDGERTEQAIVSFITKRTGPPSTLVSTQQELENFLSTSKNSKVIAYISESNSNYDTWKEVASSPSVELFSFAHVDSSVASDKAEAIQLIVQGKDAITYDGAFETTPILSWIAEHGFPLVETLNQESWQRATTHPTSKFLLSVFYDKSNEIPPFVEEVASQFLGKVVFTVSDSTQILERWGGSGTVLPSVTLLDFNRPQPQLFVWDEATDLELNSETLKSFVEESLAGTYKSNIKSEPIPQQSDSDPVKTIVARNFDQIVNNPSSQVVLVEFYAPWCGHCKKLAPVLEELGRHFESNPKVVIAKMDATANTVRSDIKIEGYPTLYAFQNGAHHPYSGGHDLEPLIAFVESFLQELDLEVEQVEL